MSHSVRRPNALRTRRHGMSLAIVMIGLSAAVVVSISLLHAQSASLRAVRNEAAAEQAHQAAESGLAAALAAMQDPNWAGVTVPITGQTATTATGNTTYAVTYERVMGDGSPGGAIVAALHVHLRSTGSYSGGGTTRPVTRTLVATVRLTPRLPDRPVRPGDVSAASDRAPDLAGFADAAAYAVFARDPGSDTFTPQPGLRVTGDVWLREGGALRLMQGPSMKWNLTLRAAYLDYLGTPEGRWAGPLGGQVHFCKSPGGSTLTDLGRLGVTVTTGGSPLPLPTFTPSGLAAYQLFAGGFTYAAVPLTSATLENTALGPSDANPLGLFTRSGGLTVRANVSVRGSLLVTGNVVIQGGNLQLTAVSGRDAGGVPLSSDAELWPLLPAVVSGGEVNITAAARGTIAGAVLAADRVTLTPSDLATNWWDYTGPPLIIAGPVMARQVTVNPPPAWAALSTSTWNDRQSDWQGSSDALPLWLANPLNWLKSFYGIPYAAWGSPYWPYGLSYFPMLTIAPPAGVTHACEPPLFRPDPAATTLGGGYRWRMLAWREELP